MNHSDLSSARQAQLHPFERPRYFHGQLLDVRHFESEQDYFKGKLWLINRLVHGYGVVCGLDVQPSSAGGPSVVVTAGLALDPWGREIVVASTSKPIEIPVFQPPENYRDEDRCDDDDWVHIVICYRECIDGPEPVLTNGCGSPEQCAHGTVRETYEIPPPRPGKAPKLDFSPSFRDPFRGRPFDYCELAEWVTRGCDPCLDKDIDRCIPLANVRRPSSADGELKEIDICPRPIVYGLDLLFEMMLAAHSEPLNRRGAKSS
jgi:hypothetical protein